MSVPIATEDDHGAYGQTVVGAIRVSRPRMEVAVAAGLGALEEGVEHLDPGVVVSSRLPEADLGERSTKVCADGSRSELDDPTPEEPVSVGEVAERTAQTGEEELREC